MKAGKGWLCLGRCVITCKPEGGGSQLCGLLGKEAAGHVGPL